MIVGTLNPATARVRRFDAGWSVAGTATYPSGSTHASWIMAAGVVVDDDDKPVFSDGRFQLRSCLFPIDRASPLRTWNVTGMRASGSND